MIILAFSFAISTLIAMISLSVAIMFTPQHEQSQLQQVNGSMLVTSTNDQPNTLMNLSLMYLNKTNATMINQLMTQEKGDMIVQAINAIVNDKWDRDDLDESLYIPVAAKEEEDNPKWEEDNNDDNGGNDGDGGSNDGGDDGSSGGSGDDEGSESPGDDNVKFGPEGPKKNPVEPEPSTPGGNGDGAAEAAEEEE